MSPAGHPQVLILQELLQQRVELHKLIEDEAAGLLAAFYVPKDQHPVNRLEPIAPVPRVWFRNSQKPPLAGSSRTWTRSRVITLSREGQTLIYQAEPLSLYAFALRYRLADQSTAFTGDGSSKAMSRVFLAGRRDEINSVLSKFYVSTHSLSPSWESLLRLSSLQAYLNDDGGLYHTDNTQSTIVTISMVRICE